MSPALPAHASLMESLELIGGENTLLLLSLEHVRSYACVQGFEFAESFARAVANEITRLKPSNVPLFYLSEGLFALLIVGGAPERALDISESLEGAMRQMPLCVEGRHVYAVLSAAIAVGTPAQVMGRALATLEEVRKRGAWNRQLYTPECDAFDRKSHNLGWMEKVRDAVDQDALLPYFQPLRHNASGAVRHYECLARLQNDQGTHPPSTFLEAARLSGLMPTLTYMMIDKSLPRFKTNDHGLSINLSAEDLRGGAFSGWLLDRCQRAGVLPSRVTLELSEAIAPSEISALKASLLELKAAGFKLALDDFGVQNANFERLIDLEFDSVKIDGRFVRHLDKDPKSRRLVETLVKLSNSLGSVTVAEYVHSAQVQKIVCDLGVDYSQGYFIGRPAASLEAG